MKYKHGTTACYNHDRCRCDLCKRAINEYTKRRASKRLEKVWEMKRNPCMDCGGSFNPWQMHFDHKGEEPKLGKISQMVTHSWKRVLEEIAKCDLVCSNCHANRTYWRKSARRNSITVEEPQDI